MIISTLVMMVETTTTVNPTYAQSGSPRVVLTVVDAVVANLVLKYGLNIAELNLINLTRDAISTCCKSKN